MGKYKLAEVFIFCNEDSFLLRSKIEYLGQRTIYFLADLFVDPRITVSSWAKVSAAYPIAA